MINLTKEAADKFKEIRKKANNPEETMLRISFGGYGWGGPKFKLTLDELKKNNDIVTESRGIKIVYNSDFGIFVDGTIIDYSDEWYNRGFTIKGGGLSSCWCWIDYRQVYIGFPIIYKFIIF